MATSLSPAVTIKEIDLTNVVPGVATSTGAAVIEAGWGPVMDITTVASETIMVQRFGKPNSSNAANWFAAANFLSYSGDLKVVRSDTTNQRNAVSVLTNTVATVPVVSGGSNYASAKVAISAPPVANGIASIAIASGGSNYDYAPDVKIAQPDQPGGIQATAVAVLEEVTPGGELRVAQINITEPGSGYTTAPVIQFGTINSGFPVPQLPGVTYTQAVAGDVVFTTGGVPATGSVTIAGNVITGIVIDNPGSGYIDEIPPTAFITDEVAVAGQVIVDAVIGTIGLVPGGVKVNNETHYEQSFANGEAVIGEWAAKYPGAFGNSILVSMADSASFAAWAYKDAFDSAPGTSTFAARAGASLDEMHIVVVDSLGKWTGTAGTVLERFSFASKASDAKKEDGAGAYYKSMINAQSAYIWWMDHPVIGTNRAAWGLTATEAAAVVGAAGAFKTMTAAITRQLTGGADHFSASDAQRINAFELFANDEVVDISLIVVGKANPVVANWVIQNLAEVRKDCMAFVSPQNANSGEVLIGSSSDIADKIVAYRNELTSSSYFVIDSGYKYQYDRYNDAYRWVPLNGDIAGLCARTDTTNDPWFSPAGLNRGQIKNVVKLAYSPKKTDRDTLYKSNVNSVVAFPGQGVVLFGDKTGLTKPSAFDRINVRRLFIVLQKAISRAAKYQLFEMNDTQTRSQFRATVEPFLRDVKGRRGVYDFLVVCDETNNTPEVIDTNRFTASIFVQPAKSINFIELNFIATRTGVAFSEVAGAA